MGKRFDYEPGDMIRAIGARYRVLKQLGAGGMGACYLVEDANINRPYVLKTLNANIAERDELRRGLELEARVLGKLHGNDHIVQAYSLNYFEDSRIPFYLMDVLNGESLRDLLRNAKDNKIDPDMACGITVQIARALNHAHQHQVVHRDVKPENIIFHRTSQGRRVAILIDFGVFKAKAVEAGFSGTAGTPGYMAPEQLRGDEVTFATDIFALGLVFYEMIIGQHPFKQYGLNAQGAVARIDKLPPTFRENRLALPSEIVDALDEVLVRCVDPNPKKRWNDASTIEVRLQKVKRMLEKAGKRPNLHEAVTSPADVPHEVLAQMTGVVDEATLAAPTNPEGVVISPRPGAIQERGIGTAATMPEAGKGQATQMTRPQGRARSPEPPAALASQVSTTPPTEPPPPAAKELDYAEDHPDSYGKMKAAMAEAEKLDREPAKKRSARPKHRPSTTNGVVSATVVESPAYSWRLRLKHGYRAFWQLWWAYPLVLLSVTGIFVWYMLHRSATPAPAAPAHSAIAPDSAAIPPAPTPSIFVATSVSAGPMGSTLPATSPSASAKPAPSHAPSPLTVGSGL